MATFAEFVTLLGYKIEGEDQLAKFEATTDSLIRGATVLAAASTAAAAAIFKIVESTSESQDELGKFALRIGESVQEIQEMAFASEQSGGSLESFKSSLQGLARISQQASIGKRGAEDFALIGVSVTDANGQLKSSIDLFQEVGDAISGLNEQEQVGIVSRLGISPDQLLLLREGREGIEALRAQARDTGSIFDEADASSAAQFNDELNILSKTVDGVFVSIARELRPAVTAVVESLSAWISENKALISTGLSVVLGTLSKVILGLLSVVGQFISGLSFLVDVLVEFRGRAIALALTLGVIFGPQLIALITSAGLAIGSLAASWLTSMGAMIASALSLNAAVLLVPAIITALGVIIFLVFDEIVTAIQGGETAFGDLVDFISARFPSVTAAMDMVFAAFDRVVDGIAVGKDAFFNFISEVAGAFDGFLEDEIAVVSRLIEMIADLLSFDFSSFKLPELPSFSGLFGDSDEGAEQRSDVEDTLSRLGNDADSRTRQEAESAASTLNTIAGDTVSSQSSIVNNNLEVEVSVAGGQTGVQTGERVADGLKDATRRLLRDTSTPFRG